METCMDSSMEVNIPHQSFVNLGSHLLNTTNESSIK